MLRQLASLGLLATALFAQSPLTTLYAWNNGGAAGWTMYFNLVVNVPLVITQIDTNSGSPATTSGTLDVYFTPTATTYVGNDTNPGAWTLGGSGPCVAAGLNLPTTCTIAPFALNPGTYGIAIVHNIISPYYTDGNGTTTPGTGTNQTYSNAELTLLAGASAGGGLGTAICCQPRVFNGSIHYTVGGGGGTVATNSTLGVGCGHTYGSFYESFANAAAVDLANTTLTWLNTGTGYTVLNAIPGTFVPPSATATNLCAGLLDGEQAVTLSAPMPVLGGTTSTLQVCTKGYIATAAGNNIDFSPTAAELLAFPQTTWACWHDFNQTAVGSGLLLYEEVAGIAYVTWNGVYSYPAVATPSTVQFQFDVASGNVTLVIGAFGTGSVDPVVVGFSPGGPSPNPGAVDISATPAIFLTTPESNGLLLAGASRPVTGTSWNLNVTSVPPTGSIGVDLFGVADPGILDLSPLGLGQTNCQLRSTLELLNAWFPAGASHAYSLPIPNNPALVNFHVFTQSAVLTLPSLSQTITSNGIDGKIGNL